MKISQKDIERAAALMAQQGGMPSTSIWSVDKFMKFTGYTVEDLEAGKIWTDCIYPILDEDGFIEGIVVKSKNLDD